MLIIASLSVDASATARTATTAIYSASTTSQAAGWLTSTYASNTGLGVKTVLWPASFCLRRAVDGPMVRLDHHIYDTVPVLPIGRQLLYDVQTRRPKCEFQFDAQAFRTWAVSGAPVHDANQAFRRHTVLKPPRRRPPRQRRPGIAISGGSTPISSAAHLTPGAGLRQRDRRQWAEWHSAQRRRQQSRSPKLIGMNAPAMPPSPTARPSLAGCSAPDEGIPSTIRPTTLIGGTIAADRNVVSGSVVTAFRSRARSRAI